MAGLRTYSSGTRAALAFLSRGRCYNPDCKRPDPIIRFVGGEPHIDYQIAHIRDAKKGNRYDVNMTDDERRSFANLVLLCKPCHDIVDKLRPQDYPADRLEGWKRDREGPMSGALAELSGIDEEQLRAVLVAAGRLAVPQWEPLIGRPARFDVPRPPQTAVARPAKLEEVVAFLGLDRTVTVTSLKGAGGVGKTVLAKQVAHDERVRAAFPGGVWWLPVGENPTLEALAQSLYRKASGGRHPAAGFSVAGQLADVLGQAPVLVLLDDVWAANGPIEELLASLPANVRTLITTRGSSPAGSATVVVDELTPEQARAILLGEHVATATPEMVCCADELARLLGHWAILVAMASAVLDLNLGGPPKRAVDAIDAIAADFRCDPTVLDDEASRDRSFTRWIERSEAYLGEPEGCQDLSRFWSLGAYPPDAALEAGLLADLWQCSYTEALRTARRIEQVGLAALLRPTDDRPLVLVIHDLILDHIHRRHCRPGQFPELHRHCAAPSIGSDGRPGQLTPSRARWLVHHLVAADEWPLLEHLATIPWRSAMLECTGSDAALLEALDAYALASLRQLGPVEATHHYFRALMFAAHLHALIGQIPVDVLVTTALLGNPIAALTQAAHRPDAGTALPAVLAIVSSNHIPHALALAGSIPDGEQQGKALAAIARSAAADETADPAWVEHTIELAACIPSSKQRNGALAAIALALAEAEPASVARVQQAVDLALSIPDDWKRHDALAGIALALPEPEVTGAARLDQAIELADFVREDWRGKGDSFGEDWGRGKALVRIARLIVASKPADPTSVERALDMAGSIRDRDQRGEALAGIALALAEADPADTAQFQQAVDLAKAIPHRAERGRALAGIAELMANTKPADAAQRQQAVELVRSIPDREQRSTALAKIARVVAQADPEGAERLVRKAVDMARSIKTEGKRRLTLAAIARLVAETDPANPVRVREAAELLDLVRGKFGHSETMAEIVSLVVMSGSSQQTRLQLAIELVGEISNDDVRSYALAAVAREMAADPGTAERLIHEAVEIDAMVRYPRERSQQLAGVARAVAATDPATAMRLVHEAIEVAAIMPVNERGSSALAKVARMMVVSDPTDVERVGRAVEMANCIDYQQQRSEALSGIALALVEGEPTEAAMVEGAVEVARSIPDDRRRGEALAQIGHSLAVARPADPTSVERAVELAASITDAKQRSVALAGIASAVAGADAETATRLVEQAVDAADSTRYGFQRASALAQIARLVAAARPADQTWIERAIQLADSITAEGPREEALAGIALALAGAKPTETAMVERAVELAGSILDDRQRGEALGRIARLLTAGRPAEPASVERAIQLTGFITDAPQRSEALAGIARSVAAVDPDTASRLVKQAVVIAGSISHSWALPTVARLVAETDPGDAGQVQQAVDLARSTADGDQQGRALEAIALALVRADPADAGQAQRAVELAGLITDRDQRREALAEIAGLRGDPALFPVSWRQSYLGDLLIAVARFASGCERYHPQLLAATTDAVWFASTCWGTVGACSQPDRQAVSTASDAPAPHDHRA